MSRLGHADKSAALLIISDKYFKSSLLVVCWGACSGDGVHLAHGPPCLIGAPVFVAWSLHRAKGAGKWLGTATLAVQFGSRFLPAYPVESASRLVSLYILVSGLSVGHAVFRATLDDCWLSCSFGTHTSHSLYFYMVRALWELKAYLSELGGV